MKIAQTPLKWLPLAGIILALILFGRSLAQTAEEEDKFLFLPVIVRAENTPTPTPTNTPTITPTATATPTATPTAVPSDIHAYINQFRTIAGSPLVSFNATLNDNCWQHARYMAENNHLTHDQNPALPYASPAGQICAEKGNAWLGGAFAVPYWTPQHSVDGWMGSVGHRLWLLYPTTPIFGYGFYTAANNRAGAALDVLSMANFGADTGYANWPVRYPAPGQSGIPATAYPITLNWRYFGNAPTLTSTSLTTSGGTPIAHTANTSLPVNHKGIQIIPSAALPNNTLFTVNIQGSYNGNPFNYTWQFATGNAQVP